MLPVAATETKQYANGLTVMQCEDGTAIIPWTPPDRKSVQEKLKSTEYDILVIGGGATGSGVALDAVTRGLKVALVEQEDFASVTDTMYFLFLEP